MYWLYIFKLQLFYSTCDKRKNLLRNMTKHITDIIWTRVARTKVRGEEVEFNIFWRDVRISDSNVACWECFIIFIFYLIYFKQSLNIIVLFYL